MRDAGARGIPIAGGILSLAATALLPFHAGGGYGAWIAAGFLAGGVLLAAASVMAGRWLGLTVWALLGAAGFVVAGAGLVGDVVERPFVPAELAAIVATGLWWAAVGRRLGDTRARWFAWFSWLCALSAAFALALQWLWVPPAGAVPARFAYVLWGPWGVWLGIVLGRPRAAR